MKLTQKKLNVKSILLITIILPLIVILVSSVAIVITAKSVQPGSTLDMSLLNKEKVSEIKNGEEALNKLQELAENMKASGIAKYSGSTSVNIEKTECEDKNIEKILSFMSSSFSEKFAAMYESTSVKYGEDTSYLLTLLPDSAPSSFTYSAEENTATAVLTYDSVFTNMYFLKEDTASLNLFTKENEGVFSAINEKFIPVSVEFTYKYDLKENRITSFSCSRTYEYSSHISFKNTLSDIGSTPLKMLLCVTEHYDISFAGIKIEEDILTLSKNGYDTLTVNPFTEENLKEDEYTLSFTTSDENTATVDINGQVKAVKESEEPVKITVTLSYLGKTFTDSCMVYVVTPVESIRISDTTLELKKGDTHLLTAEIAPDDATVKTAGFISSDENIVTVSSDGKITALKEGTATVYAYSLQGYLSTECTVTVTK